MTAERIEKAKKLKLIITAGIGSDHTDIEAANKHGGTVADARAQRIGHFAAAFL